MIKVCFLAQLREQTGRESVSVKAEAIGNLVDLKARLLSDYPEWRPFLERDSLLLAVNHNLVRFDCPLRDGDEVAFMPPVTGG